MNLSLLFAIIKLKNNSIPVAAAAANETTISIIRLFMFPSFFESKLSIIKYLSNSLLIKKTTENRN